MKTQRVNGLQFEKLLRNGLNQLALHEEEINRLNVFPVPDGDTGTNMRLTLEHGLELAKSNPELGAYLKSLSDGLLLGARGNSGVILSQIFRGFSQELARLSSASAANLRNGFIRGYRVAYRAVARPVEGTMLTVAREGVEGIRSQIGRSSFIEDFFNMFTAEMKKSLAHTPDMLPVLKEAGVVDSGAQGLILIVEGMLKALYGEWIPEKSTDEFVLGETGKDGNASAEVNYDAFDENSGMEFGYCVEFILRFMSGKAYRQDFNETRFAEALERIGNSTVVVRSGKILKVHVHVKKPSAVFRLAESYGEFLSVKVENMEIQHHEHMEKLEVQKRIVKTVAFVAVANSPETTDLFTSLGADIVLPGGETMNTSAEEFVTAFREIDAKKIVVLPNNRNIVAAALQAASLMEGEDIEVLETGNIAEGYYALAADIPDSSDPEARVSSMRRALSSITVLSVTKAVRDTAIGGVESREGEFIVLSGGNLTVSMPDREEAVLAVLSRVEGIEEKDAILLFAGEGVTEEETETLTERLSEVYPFTEVTVLSSRQPVYDYLIGIV